MSGDMKIRNGFVSNSSSSSYIIAFKMGDPCEHCGRKDPDVLSFIGKNEYSYGDSTVKAYNLQETFEMLKNDYNLNSDYNELDEDYKQARVESFIEFARVVAKIAKYADNYQIAFINVAYSDSVNNILKIFNNVEIIEAFG